MVKALVYSFFLMVKALADSFFLMVKALADNFFAKVHRQREIKCGNYNNGVESKS